MASWLLREKSPKNHLPALLFESVIFLFNKVKLLRRSSHGKSAIFVANQTTPLAYTTPRNSRPYDQGLLTIGFNLCNKALIKIQCQPKVSADFSPRCKSIKARD